MWQLLAAFSEHVQTRLYETPDPDLSVHFATYMALQSRWIELSAKIL